MEGWLQPYPQSCAEGSLASQPELNCLGQAPQSDRPMNLAINRKHFLATRRERSFLSRVPQSCNFLRTGKCLLLQHHLNLPAYLLRFQP